MEICSAKFSNVALFSILITCAFDLNSLKDTIRDNSLYSPTQDIPSSCNDFTIIPVNRNYDDGGYGMLRFDQKVMSHPERGVNLFNPNWQLLAESFEIDFIKSDLESLAEVLRKRAASNTPGIVLIEGEIYPPKSTSPRWNES